MTSSSNLSLERGLDTMIIVYSLLAQHPASAVCEQFIRARSGWFTTALTLLEVKAILTKVYGVDAQHSSGKLLQFAGGPIAVLGIEATTIFAALSQADSLKIDLTDAALLSSTMAANATSIATDDAKFAQACVQCNLVVENPIDNYTRQQIAAWETANLPTKGLPRILRRVHEWLDQVHPPTAQSFWSQTGGGSHLP